MYNLVGEIIKFSGEVAEKLGEVTSKVIDTSRGGRYAQRDGETDEAYKLRLEFLLEKFKLQQASKDKHKEIKAKNKADRREEKNLRRQERQEARQEAKNRKRLK
jgi:hypothetical protein